jgi:alkyl sulfatase BDS1-like metallo-beta-lactamase superfamily hydrolase
MSWALLTILACAEEKPPPLKSHADLAAHTKEFRQEVIKVTEGVYVAVGFGLANSVLLEGEDGVVIVDTMESAEAAEPVKAAFSRITKKPVKAIIYTHFHADHVFGARVMAGGDRPDIISHARTLYWLDRIVNITRETTYRRAMRQFGTLLPEGGCINAGIGPRLLFDANSTPALLRPNKTFSGERLELEVAGLKLVLVHAPGETPDQIFVWLPEKRVLLPADNFYKSFPNLYAIRGTAYRDVTLWVKSLDRMRALRAAYLVPHHTRPMAGEKQIHETLTHYRDAIQFVHDQTIRLMNEGLTPGQIVEKVKLPPHLARQPYLQEYYGTLAWSVRAVFDGYLGWFGGNPTDLFPLPPGERADRFAELAGGESALMDQARRAVSGKHYQWALELTDPLLILKPENAEVRALRSAALKALGEQQVAATARNYYLTRALETEGKIKIGKLPVQGGREMVHAVPLQAIFSSMAVRLNPEKSALLDQVVGFRFPDTGEAYMIHVRRGVAEIQPRFFHRPDQIVTVNASVWKEVAAGLRSPALALLKGDIQIQGGTLDLVKFLRLFKSD